MAISNRVRSQDFYRLASARGLWLKLYTVVPGWNNQQDGIVRPALVDLYSTQGILLQF